MTHCSYFFVVRFTNKEEAYGNATVHLMQYIENKINQWPKPLVLENHAKITDMCTQTKHLTTYESRFSHLSETCQDLFKDHFPIRFQVLPITQNQSTSSQSIDESLFKIKLRNFLDVFQSRFDVEEDLGNSEDDEEEEEDETYESEEESEEQGEEEEDLEEEEDYEEEIEEDDDEEPKTSETVIHDSESEQEEEEEEGSSLKRKASTLEEDNEDEEDEIDEDELDDDDTTKKRRSA